MKLFAGGLADVFRYYAALSDRRKLGAATARVAARRPRARRAHGQITVTSAARPQPTTHVSWALSG